MSNNSLTTTARLRIKEPVYTSDKRAKFTQRESKKWIRFCTVIGYIFFVSLPATSLSIYYIWIWNPDYISRFPPDKNRTLKTDYIAKPMLSVRQGSRPRYKLDLLKESNTSSRISKNLIRASLYPSFTRTTERFLEQKPLKVSHKISQHIESSNTAGTVKSSLNSRFRPSTGNETKSIIALKLETYNTVIQRPYSQLQSAAAF